MSDVERLKGFMEKVEEACKEFDIRLNSCGCCGGIWVESESTPFDTLAEYSSISYDPPFELEPPLPPHEHQWEELYADNPHITGRRCTVKGCYESETSLT